jgi:hypothetical protein
MYSDSSQLIDVKKLIEATLIKPVIDKIQVHRMNRSTASPKIWSCKRKELL